MDEQETAKTEVQEDKPLADSDRIRLATKKRFIEVLTLDGSVLSNELVASLLDTSYKTVYRWKGADSHFMPKIKECGGVLRFCADVTRVRAEMFELAVAWPGVFGGMDRNTLMVLFGPDLVRIFRDLTTTAREKAEEAALYYLKRYAVELRKREKMAMTLTKAPDWTGRGGE
jgi:hypothetical protein